MKTFCFGIALAIALPSIAIAQTTPAAPAHAEHHGHMDHKSMGTDKDCCCEKMKAEGKKMDCCNKSDSKKPATDAHTGHDATQH